MSEIDNPCSHCYQCVISEYMRCKYDRKYWFRYLGSETVEVEKEEDEENE